MQWPAARLKTCSERTKLFQFHITVPRPAVPHKIFLPPKWSVATATSQDSADPNEWDVVFFFDMPRQVALAGKSLGASATMETAISIVWRAISIVWGAFSIIWRVFQ
ncbi:uncharacterized protein TrAtP1_000130 [Trichoderma atroviride]|uniref:uncharacterized protein n=1 Tax=Hypocrea atroviridis TaxID=63577 RepID=UPI0033239123|nr:hypothetical protein TrAtP1_000130 [Trichoderma atroviride]